MARVRQKPRRKQSRYPGQVILLGLALLVGVIVGRGPRSRTQHGVLHRRNVPLRRRRCGAGADRGVDLVCGDGHRAAFTKSDRLTVTAPDLFP